MKLITALTLIIAFLFAPAVHAQVETIAQNVQLKALCAISSPHKGCSLKSLPDPLQLAILSCNMVVQSATCQEFAAKEPAFKEDLRHCEPAQFCRDYETQELMSFASCGKGYYGGSKEIFKNLWGDIQKKNKLLALCDLQCKKKMVEGIPKFAGMSDTDLARYPAPALSVARDNYDYAQSTYRRQSLMSPSLMERAERSEAYDQTRSTEISSNPTLDASAALGVMNWLQKKGARLECMDTQKRIETMCWGAASIIDPTILVGGAFKGVEVVRYLASLAKTSEVAEKTTEAVAGASRLNLVVDDGVSELWQGGRKLDMPQLPSSLSVTEHASDDGSTYLVANHAVKTATGETKVVMSELPVDKLTGAFDANYPGGREFLSNILKDKRGEVSFAFVDINNLGYVNKNFARGFEAGNEYFKNVAEAIKKATDGKADIFRLGGDELGLVIYEKDPKKVQEILSKIMNMTYSGDVSSTFQNELYARFQAYKAGGDKNAWNSFLPYSKQGISLGATQVGATDDLSSVLARAESQAQQMKIETKEQMNIDASKYGGAAADPTGVANQRYVPQAMPLQTVDQGAVTEKAASLNNATGVVSEVPDGPVRQVGNITIVQYKDEMGNTVLRTERNASYNAQGKPVKEVRDLPVNEKTGFIDGNSDAGQKMLKIFVSSEDASKNKAMLWVNAGNLGKVNYFAQGSQAGDALLEATSAVIKKQVGDLGVPFKAKGSEFIVTMDNMPPAKAAQLQSQIREALATDPAVSKIFNDQQQFLQQKLAQVGPGTPEGAKVAKSLADLAKLRQQFSVNSLAVTPTDTLPALMSRLAQP